MTNHVLLDNVAHKDLRINKRYAPGRGLDFNIARVFPVELGYLQAEYPLFFIRNADSGHFETVALLGFSEGENLYLGGDRWLAEHQPLSVERQPFLIGFQELHDQGAPEKVPVVTLDMDDPSVSDSEGEPVFLAHGGESPLLERINTVLATIHQGHDEGRVFSQVLVGLDLIESVALEIEFNDGSKQKVQGLYSISEERLRQLESAGLETLHRGGHLQTLYMLLASLPNLPRLIERKNRALAA